MPIEPIKIPQNVYVEDRIVGPLTVKQVLIVGAGAGFSYILYSMLTQAYGALALPLTLLVWSPTGVAAVFAFIRINDVSMFKLLLLTIEKINKPSIRTWSPRRGIMINIRTSSGQKETAHVAQPVKEPMHLDELSSVLDLAPRAHQTETPEPLSPLEEEVEEVEEVLEVSTPEPVIQLPVNKARISATPLQGTGTVSLFRDLTPHS
jgi:hypothetical protein